MASATLILAGSTTVGVAVGVVVGVGLGVRVKVSVGVGLGLSVGVGLDVKGIVVGSEELPQLARIKSINIAETTIRKFFTAASSLFYIIA